MRIFTYSNSLKSRLALGFGISFTLLLAAAFFFIYSSSATFRKDDFYNRLRDRALTTYKLLIEVDEIDTNLLKVIDINTPNSVVPQQRVLIFQDSTLIYSYHGTGSTAFERGLPTRIGSDKALFYNMGKAEGLGLFMERKANRYYILSSGTDTFGFRKLSFLKWAMLIAYFTGVIFGWVAIYFFVKRMIKPLDRLQANLKNINYDNLDTRLPERGQGEEVNNLSADFNQLLARLDKAFRFQKDFVHYASHELRTPLSIMVSLTENSLNGTKTTQQYKNILGQLLYQQENLTDMTNSLLLLADNKGDTYSRHYPLVRLDELLFRAVDIAKDLFPEAGVELNMEGTPAGEEAFLIPANEPLMLMAFNNLLKNALQYAPDGNVKIRVALTETSKQICFMNAGRALSDEERENIFTPFYRAPNAVTVKGHGLGLSLVKQIIQSHGGQIEYTHTGQLNVFAVLFA